LAAFPSAWPAPALFAPFLIPDSMMSTRFRQTMPVLVSLLLALSLTSCSQKTETAAGGGKAGEGGGGGGGKGKGKGAGGPAPVIVGKVQRKVVPLVIDAIGAVEPIRSTAVRSQVTGVLQKIAIKEGQDVKVGDLLFEIDPRPFRNALQSAEADRQRIRAQLETAKAQVERYRALSVDQNVSKEQFQKLEADARSLTAQAESSEAAVANAKLQLEYCSIRAPIAGRTGNMTVHEGDLVRTNAATTDSGVLVTINQLSPIYVTFGVPQQHLATITRYRAEGALKVKAVPPGTEEKGEFGELTFLDNMVDASTGTIKLKGTFSNEEHRLWPGQFCTVAITLSSPEVLTVPSSAVQTAQSGQHVFVVKPDKVAELRSVVIERAFEADSVVAKGLNEGETIVVDGQLRVIPGKPVEIKEGAAPGATPAGGSGKGGKGGEGKKGKKQGTKEPVPASGS
jgi:membrane fusion protein, multidrug efflux system